MWWPMHELAERTGGVEFHLRNDVDVEMQEAVADAEASYTLGFYASQDSGQVGFHKLTVRALRPGVTLGYKDGYYVDAPEKITAEARQESINEALAGLVDATSIPVDVKATRRDKTLNLRVGLQPDSLGLNQNGDRWQGAVTFITHFTNEDGSETAPLVSERIEYNLRQESYEAAGRNGLVLSRTLELPAGTARLRVLIRNEPSGQIGTLTIPVKDIPAE